MLQSGTRERAKCANVREENQNPGLSPGVSSWRGCKGWVGAGRVCGTETVVKSTFCGQVMNCLEHACSVTLRNIFATIYKMQLQACHAADTGPSVTRSLSVSSSQHRRVRITAQPPTQALVGPVALLYPPECCHNAHVHSLAASLPQLSG